MDKRKKSKDELEGEELGQRLLKSVREVNVGQAARVTKVASNEVADARLESEPSQAEIAEVVGISKRTLQEWEQGRRSPSASRANLNQNRETSLGTVTGSNDGLVGTRKPALKSVAKLLRNTGRLASRRVYRLPKAKGGYQGFALSIIQLAEQLICSPAVCRSLRS